MTEYVGEKRKYLDIVFLIDVSGSMRPHIEAVKNNLDLLVRHIATPGANAESAVQGWRVKVCGYRSITAELTDWWEERPFTSDVSQVLADLNSLTVKGDGNQQRPLLDGLWKLAKLPAAAAKGEAAGPDMWRHHHDVSRCVTVFTDASCQMVTSAPEAGGATFDDVASEVITARLLIFLCAPEAACYYAVSAIDRAELECVKSPSGVQPEVIRKGLHRMTDWSIEAPIYFDLDGSPTGYPPTPEDSWIIVDTLATKLDNQRISQLKNMGVEESRVLPCEPIIPPYPTVSVLTKEKPMTQDSLGKKKGIADIVFLIDVSGSMQKCIDALKSNIGVLVESMVNPGPNAEAVVKDWRIKVCGYRDAISDGSMWWEEKPFTNELAQVRADLASLEAKGGDDEPESLLDGLWKLAKLPAAPAKGEVAGADMWRHHHDAARCVIVFTDASCHMVTSAPEAGGATFDDVAREVMAARLRISLYAPETDCYQTVSAIDKCEWEIVGSLTDAVEKMAEFSANTANFRKTMEQLAKSISVSSTTPTL